MGRVLGGKYRLVRVIGRGGMSAVFEAEQTNLLRTVALKVADPAVTSQPGFLEQFQQEAKIIARLEHPHILPVYDVGEDGGHFYLVMRLVTEGTLKDWLHREPTRTPAAALALAQQVLPALEYAHQHGVVHRDVKPSNVLMQGDWAWLSDFGMAKLLSPELDLGLTRPGAFLGTPEYMAPEQVLGKPVDGPHRPVLVWRHPLPAAHRAGAVPGRDAHGRGPPALARPPTIPASSEPHRVGCRGSGAAAGAGA